MKRYKTFRISVQDYYIVFLILISPRKKVSCIVIVNMQSRIRAIHIKILLSDINDNGVYFNYIHSNIGVSF